MSIRSPRRVVVVGSGAAGLVTALEMRRLAPEVDVLVVTKGLLDEGNTRYAQGGIAAAVMPGDSVESHVSDTLAAGAGLSDAEAVRVLCSEGPAAIAELVRWGVAFDRAGAAGSATAGAAPWGAGSGVGGPFGGGPFPGGPFDAGLEGAHSHHRILHAGGDATGAAIERALVRAVREAGIAVVERAFLVDLVVSAGEVRGVRLLEDGLEREIAADAVVLATGGIGQLYPYTTNPAVTTGDGAAAALRAGAELQDVEFVQFHPTALAVPGSFLVSEAVRGDGAVLVDSTGRRFMPDAHPLAELAPRDVVARAIAARMAAGSPVYLDATALGREELARRFPTIDAASRAAGFDWAAEPLPVAPAAHYWMGGIATDLDARATLPGLLAVGEVACTGVHGANRLASNSLLEAVVFARRAARTAVGQGDVGQVLAERGGISPVPSGAPTGLRGASAATPAASRGPSLTRQELHDVMWEAAGLHRSGGALAAAGERLMAAGAHVARTDVPFASAPEHPATRGALGALGDAASGHPSARGALGALGDAVLRHPASRSAPDVVRDLETENLRLLGAAVVQSALRREESRGAHFRSDFPGPDPAFAHHSRVTIAQLAPAAHPTD